MVKTLTLSPNRRERGAALLEAAIALALVALIAAAGISAFSAAGRASADAAADMRALTLAENAIERASAPGFLRRALDEGEAVREGDGWRVTAIPYAADPGDSPLALVEIRAEAGEVVLKTLRSLPR